MNKKNYNELQKCCSCGMEVETDDHLFQCAKRPAFRKKIRKSFKKLGSSMCKKLYSIFQHCVLDFITPQSEQRWKIDRFFDAISKFITSNTIRNSQNCCHKNRRLIGMIYCKKNCQCYGGNIKINMKRSSNTESVNVLRMHTLRSHRERKLTDFKLSLLIR